MLIGLLPPLLYAASIRTSLIDFRANRRPIALLSVGLVLFTTVGVGLLVWWLLDVPLAVGFALGAVVAPPDAVAATSIARRIGLPRRVVTILEGESLVNDATAIVTLRASIAAIGGSVSVWQIGAGFFVSAIGGALIGVVVAFVVGKIRNLIQDDVTDVAVSLLTPWIAYLPAEEIHSMASTPTRRVCSRSSLPGSSSATSLRSSSRHRRGCSSARTGRRSRTSWRTPSSC